MPYQPLVFAPGINRMSTAYNNEGAWFEANRVRFRDNRPEPIGGWQPRTYTGDLIGTVRTKHTWRTNSGSVIEAFGSSQGLFLISDGTVFDITPARLSFIDEADPLSISSGSSTLTITTTTHNTIVGERVVLSGFDLTAQGITLGALNTTFFVASVPSSTTVTVDLEETATGTVSGGGGTGSILFLLRAGAESTVFGNGWSAGAFGVGTFGTPRSTTVAQSIARVWSLDNFGEILVGTFRDGTPVKWDPTSDGLSARSIAIPNCPKGDILLVSSPDRHLVLFSAVLPGESVVNRLAVRWSDQEDFTEWSVTATTTAGSQLLSVGSEIAAAELNSRQITVWTDTAITAMQFIGVPFTFGFQQLDYSPEIVSRNAAVEVDGTVLWMAVGSFYIFDGIARVLPCSIKDVVFDNYNLNQKEKFFGVINQEYHEVWWFYVSAGASEIDSYVLYDYVDQQWSYGTLVRTCWEDAGLTDTPSAVGINGQLYDHETGTSDEGASLSAFVKSAPFDIGEGDQMMFVQGIVPDARMVGTGNMQITLTGRRYPQSAETTYGPYEVTSQTDRIRTRLRVRQVTFKYSTDSADLFWQGGKPKLLLKPQGKY
jgi:hypothetical protein